MPETNQPTAPQDDDILTNLSSEIARLQAIARESHAKAQQLEAAANMIRVARGTSVGDAPPEAYDPVPDTTPPPRRAASPTAPATVPHDITLPPNLERRARPRSKTTEGLAAQIESLLSSRSMRALELAATVGTTPELMQGALDQLQRDGKVYRFVDGAYTWRVRNPSSDVLNLLIKRYMTERHVSRAELRGAIPHDDEVGKMQGKRIDNHLDIVRSHEPVWAQADERGNMVYWLVPGQTPPRDLDGRRVKRIRTRATQVQTKKTSQVTKKKSRP